MRKCIQPVMLSLILNCAAFSALGQGGPSDADAPAGHALALKICAACHMVSSDQQFPPILRQPAPDFQMIANRPGTTADSLRNFVSTTHRTVNQPFDMPALDLTGDMTTKVVSYILSLRTRP
jgi:mono/diheme cytochrome c family protein